MEYVFYSWQSDLSNKFNRTFIQNSIESAIKEINQNIELEISLDRDTYKLPGSPDIVNSIFNKINQSRIFIADISIINSKEISRKTPNPNVLLELGYASAIIGWDNIICIFNEEYGTTDELPFDLKFRRILKYKKNEDLENSTIKKEFYKDVKTAISIILNSGLPKLKIDIINYFNDVNPQIMINLKHGVARFSINLNYNNESKLNEFSKEKYFIDLIEFKSNGCSLSNNTNSNGGINDLNFGSLNGYDIFFKSKLE